MKFLVTKTPQSYKTERVEVRLHPDTKRDLAARAVGFAIGTLGLIAASRYIEKAKNSE